MYHAYAKINLGLYVLQKRPDGFHDITTVYHRIGWSDELVLEDDAVITVSSTDPAAPGGDKNICHRAATAVQRATGQTRGVHIRLSKHIPVGAGLGGGSSDAATVLRALPAFWNAALDEPARDLIALRLGSDVPYFLRPGSAVGCGRGERLDYFDLNIPFTLLVCFPGIHVSTAWAYEHVTPAPGPSSEELRALVTEGMQNPPLLTAELRNVFETAVFNEYPEIGSVKQSMLASGAAYASLSGSGSAVFGLFDDTGAAETAARKFSRSGYRSSITPPSFSPA